MSNGKPSQLTFLRPAQMLLFATPLCDPPLGQSTIVAPDVDEVKFTVLIESSISFSNQAWEAVIWHNGHEDGRWDGLQLDEVNVSTEPLAVSSSGRANVHRRYLSGHITRPSKGNAPAIVQFTLKYRTTESEWRWVNDHANLQDGTICFQSSTIPSRLEHYLQGIDSCFDIVSPKSDVPQTKLWTLSLPADAAGNESSFTKRRLGVPSQLSRWFALVRLWAPWLAPRHGRSSFSVDEDALMASFLREDGLHFVLLGVSGDKNTLTVLNDDGDGSVLVSTRNDGDKCLNGTVLAAVGHTFADALAACVSHARSMANQHWEISGPLSDELEPSETGDRRLKRLQQRQNLPYRQTWRSQWLDGLTYCTWNALGQKLTEKKILDALDALDKNGIKITNLIIDDNWQSLDNPGKRQTYRGWTRFEANEEGFPDGLAHCVYEARDRHPSIDHVAVWHAMLGYWGAISPTGQLAKEYKTRIVQKEHKGEATGENITIIDADDLERFYNDFYHFLQTCRVDSVKTDAQFMLDLIHDPKDRRDLIKKYQDVWTVSSLKWMSTQAISCMSLIPQIIFHTLLPTDRPQICVRNSDDFFPEVPASHTWHVFCNAYTSLFTHHLNALPDWDMFQTCHEYSSFHAAARCISGGPVYITDEPGKHDIDLIAEMTAKDNRGSTIILRPSTVGRTADSGVYTSYDDERLLRTSTYHGERATGSGILGVFNVSRSALSELVLLRDFPGNVKDQRYIIRAHMTGQISRPMQVDDKLSLVSVFLDVKHWEILTAHPLIIQDGMAVAPLGLLGKMTGVAAIVDSSVEKDHQNRLRVSVSLKAFGTFGLYVEDLPKKSVRDDLFATLNGRAVPLDTVNVDEELLTVDLYKAWKEIGLAPGYNNEINLTIVIR